MRSVRIPFLIDIKRVESKPDIEAVPLDPRLHPALPRCGPLVNRILTGRINGALRFGGKPLPAVAPRGDAERARSQAGLRTRLDPAKGPLWDPQTLVRLVATVRGQAGVDTIGPPAQQAVGRLFNKDYV